MFVHDSGEKGESRECLCTCVCKYDYAAVKKTCVVPERWCFVQRARVRTSMCVCVRVCGRHMLPITSPICVNCHKSRNRVRHSDGNLKDIGGGEGCV